MTTISLGQRVISLPDFGRLKNGLSNARDTAANNLGTLIETLNSARATAVYQAIDLAAYAEDRFEEALDAARSFAVNGAINLTTEMRPLEHIVDIDLMHSYLSNKYSIRLGKKPTMWASEAKRGLVGEHYESFVEDISGVVLVKTHYQNNPNGSGGSESSMYYTFDGHRFARDPYFKPTLVRRISGQKLALIGLGFTIAGLGCTSTLASDPEPTTIVPPPDDSEDNSYGSHVATSTVKADSNTQTTLGNQEPANSALSSNAGDDSPPNQNYAGSTQDSSLEKKVATKPKATATLEPVVLKPFEFVCDGCTADQYETFSKNALEDYRTVLGVYGISEEDARMVVSVRLNDFGGTGGYGIGFFYNGKEGRAAGNLNDLTTDRRGKRHEDAHAINDTLFLTYHSWFDEGMAMYASGEVNSIVNGDVLLRNPKNSKELIRYSFDEALSLLKSDSSDYWQRKSSSNAGHTLGSHFFAILIKDYGLTKEQNRTALSELNITHSETGEELTKADIQKAYETTLGVSLDPLFDLLRPGVMLLYSTDPSIAGTKGYKTNIRIRSEFQN